MARLRNLERKDRWYFNKTDERFYKGYCYKRNNKCFTFIKTKLGYIKQSTDLPWANANKSKGLEILDYRLRESYECRNEALTFYQLYDNYAATHFPNYAKYTIFHYQRAVSDLIKKDFELIDVLTIQEHIIKNLKELTVRLNPNTIRKHLEILHAIFEYGVNNNFITKNPVINSMKPKPVKTKIVVFTKDEINRIISHLRNSGKYDYSELILLIRLIAESGMRLGETMKLKAVDIDKEKIIIHGKGDRFREFPIEPFPELIDVLDSLINRRAKHEKLFSWKNEQTPEKIFKATRLACGIDKDGSFHSIRKMRENELINDERLDMNTVAQLMGHSLRIQEKHYLEILGAKRLTEIILKNKENKKG